MKNAKCKIKNKNLQSKICNLQFAIKQQGFSLVELLISMAIASVVGMAGYVIFSSSNWSYKVQEDVSEAQQNVRVAMERLAGDVRTAGFGLPDPPFSLTFTGLSTTFVGQSGNSITLTSPITVSNSAAVPDTITILGIGYEAGVLENDANDDGIEDNNSCNGAGDGLICLGSANSANNFFTGSGPYTYETNRRYISLNGAAFIELANAQTDANRSAGMLSLGTPATLDRNYPDGTSVYIIQAVQYTINDTAPFLTGCSATNPCLVSADTTMLRGGSTPGAREVLAENIEDIQFAYGIDVSPRDGMIDYTSPYSDGAFVFSATGAAALSDPSSIIAVKANIVAKTRNQDPKGATGFKSQCFEDRLVDAGTTNCTGAVSDGYRRRALTKIIKLRNPKQGA